MTIVRSTCCIILVLLLAGVATGDAGGLVLCIEADGRAVLEAAEREGCCSGATKVDGLSGIEQRLATAVPLECGPCNDLAEIAFKASPSRNMVNAVCIQPLWLTPSTPPLIARVDEFHFPPHLVCLHSVRILR